MRYGYETRTKTDFKKLASFFLFWILLSGVAFANVCPLQEFKQYAEKLDKNNIVSVDKLKDRYKELAPGQSLQCSSLLFKDLMHYHVPMIMQYAESIEKKLNKVDFKELEQYRAKLYNAGIGIQRNEGYYYVIANSTWYLNEFGAFLADDWKKFLKQCAYEEKHKFTDDTAVMITWEALRKRVLFWEFFLDEYPDFFSKNKVEEYLSRYISTYLLGSGNSTIYAYDSKKLLHKIKKSYENFIRLNSESQYHKIVKNQYSIIESNAFIVDKKTGKKLDINYDCAVREHFDASFECCRASTSIEKYICSDKELAQSDEGLGILYKYIKTYSSKKDRKSLVKKQRVWAKNRAKACRVPREFYKYKKVVECLNEEYQNRMEELWTIVDGDSLELGPWYYVKRDSKDPFAGYYSQFYEVHSATTLEDSSVVENSLSIIKIKDSKMKNMYRVSGDFTCANYHVCSIYTGMLSYIIMELKDGKLIFSQKAFDDKVCKFSIKKNKNTLVINDENNLCTQYNFSCGARCGLNEYEFKLKTTDEFAQNYRKEKLYPFQKDAKFGFINIKGEWVIKPQFDEVQDFNEAINNLATAEVKLNGKEGTINRKGEFTPRWSEDDAKDDTNKSTSDTEQKIPLEEKLYSLKKGDKHGFINTKGEWVFEPEFEDAHSFYKNGIAEVKINDKWGYINTKSEWIIEPQFDDVSAYLYSPWVQYLDKDLVKVKVNNKWGIVNTRKGEIVIEPKFEDIDSFDINGLAKVKLGSKEGYINTKGKIIIEPKFDSISNNFSKNGLAEVELNGKWGYINAKGELVIEPKFDAASSFDENGMAAVKLKGKWGLVDTKGNWILEPQFYEAVEFAKNGLAKVPKNGKYGFINTKGEWAIEPQFDEAEDFEGSLTTIVKLNGKWGIVNTEGKWVIEPQLQFEDIDTSNIYNGVISVTHNGKISIVNAKGKWLTKLKFDEIMVIDDADGIVDMNGWIKVKLDKKWGVIDTEGNWIFKPRFDDVGFFSVVNMIVAKHNGKWGLIDAKGKWVLKPQFDSIDTYGDSGRGIVEYNGKWGLINDEGEWILKPLFYNFFDIMNTYFMSKTGLLTIGTHDDKKGVMDRKANLILEKKFDDVEILDDLIYVTFGDQEGYTTLNGKYLTFCEDDIDNMRKMEDDKKASEETVSYAKSCEGGYAFACYLLGNRYDSGWGVKQDNAKAAEFFGKACDAGDIAGCFVLGNRYREGKGVEQDDAKAVEFYLKACEGGDAEGCHNLGLTYADGKGVKQDDVKAVELYGKACDGGYGNGCHNLGYMYARGLGVKQDDLKAKKFYIEACNKGYARDCADIGLQNIVKHSKRNSTKNRIRFPFVCYEKKSGNKKRDLKYHGCFRSNEKCSDLDKMHFGKYPNDFDAHEAFKRCSKGDPKFSDSRGK